MDESTCHNLNVSRQMHARRSAEIEAEHWGGYREGAGRKSLAEEPTESHSTTMPQSYWQLVQELGAGNYSAGLRKLVEWYREHLELE